MPSVGGVRERFQDLVADHRFGQHRVASGLECHPMMLGRSMRRERYYGQVSICVGGAQKTRDIQSARGTPQGDIHQDCGNRRISKQDLLFHRCEVGGDADGIDVMEKHAHHFLGRRIIFY